MQIYELTQRKPVNEVLGALASLAGGVAKAGAEKFVQSQTGGSLTPDKISGGPNARMGAYKINNAVIGPLAKQLQLSWAKALQEFLSRTKDTAGNPATNLAAVSPGSVATLEPQLITMINNTIGKGSNYKDLAKNAGQDQVAVQAAKEVTAAIDKGITTVMNATMKPGNNSRQLATAWIELVRDGIAPAQQIITFDRGSQDNANTAQANKQIQIVQDPTTGAWAINGQPLQTALKNPTYKAAWDNMQKASGK